jgi:hypothetical protein
MPEQLWMALAVLVLVALIGGSYIVREQLRGDPWADKMLLDKGTELPVLWLYYDDSQVNSRHWLDFGARSGRVINMPFMNLCYESIVRANGRDYRIEVIAGVAGVQERLGGDLPGRLKSSLATIGPAEKNWIRAAILAKYGGLWLEPSSIALKGFGPLPKDRVVFFGTDLDKSYSGTGGTTIPGFRAIWCPYKGHPLFVDYEMSVRRRLNEQGGGTQIRGDDKWDFVANFHGRPGVEVRPGAELARKGRAGKRIELDDLLAAGQEGKLPFDVPADAIYLALPMRDIELRRQFGWFLRLSEDQILESDLAITTIFKAALGR